MNDIFGKGYCHITFDLDKVYLVCKKEHSSQSIRRCMTLDTFINNIKAIDSSMSTPYLPPNCFKYKAINNNHTFLLYFPSKKIDLKYTNKSSQGTGNEPIVTYNNALFPSFVLKVTYIKDVFSEAFIYMLPKDISLQMELNDSTPLNKMLFPNIYDSGKICFGRLLTGTNGDSVNINQKVANLAADIFRNSVFNKDLFSCNMRTITNSMNNLTDEHEYFTYLTTIDEWPDVLCIPDNITIGGL